MSSICVATSWKTVIFCTGNTKAVDELSLITNNQTLAVCEARSHKMFRLVGLICSKNYLSLFKITYYLLLQNVDYAHVFSHCLIFSSASLILFWTGGIKGAERGGELKGQTQILATLENKSVPSKELASLIFPFPLQFLDVLPALIFHTECRQHFTVQTFCHKTCRYFIFRCFERLIFKSVNHSTRIKVSYAFAGQN